MISMPAPVVRRSGAFHCFSATRLLPVTPPRMPGVASAISTSGERLRSDSGSPERVGRGCGVWRHDVGVRRELGRDPGRQCGARGRSDDAAGSRRDRDIRAWQQQRSRVSSQPRRGGRGRPRRPRRAADRPADRRRGDRGCRDRAVAVRRRPAGGTRRGGDRLAGRRRDARTARGRLLRRQHWGGRRPDRGSGAHGGRRGRRITGRPARSPASRSPACARRRC